MTVLRDLFHRAHQSAQRGDMAGAAVIAEEMLRLDPNATSALEILVSLAQDPANRRNLLERVDRVIADRPADAAAHFCRGSLLRGLGREAEAALAFQKTVTTSPTMAEGHHQLGNALKAIGRYAEAAAALRTAVRLAPDSAPAWLNLGVACLELGASEDAVSAFRRAVSLEPQRAAGHNILGSALLSCGKVAEAESHLLEALRLQPAYPAAEDNFGRLRRQQGRMREAIDYFRRALAGRPQPATHSNLLLALNYLPDSSPEEIAQEHFRWRQLHAGHLAPKERPKVRPLDGRRLRIGYVSPDFNHHAVAFFFEPVLRAHDRRHVEVFCYSNVAVGDGVTERLRSLAEHWREIAFVEDFAAVSLIKDDQIDVLVDLAGHTARHRLGIFARRAAPVQVTWLGYPNTTGLTEIDFRLTDATSDPVGQTEGWHSESLWRLPDGFLTYGPPPEAPRVIDPPHLQRGYLTFGCFNHAAKINQQCIRLWAAVLQKVPGSRLLLKARGLHEATTIERLASEFAGLGITPERLTFRGERLSVVDQLALVQSVDLALDTFPYNGTTTTCESLWMGVPVVALAGRTHVARVGASLLRQVGLEACVAPEESEYVERACRFAKDSAWLTEMRRSLRTRFRASSLGDAVKFTSQLEEAFVRMCRNRS